MTKQFNTIKDRVKAILEVSESSRNCDASLVANYWYKWDKHFLNGIKSIDNINGADKTVTYPSLMLCKYEDITQPSVIERARRLIQEEVTLMPETNSEQIEAKLHEMKKYFPTNPKIIKLRRLSSKIWKEYINNNKINIVMEQT